jgi:hypothetical protein
MTLFFLQILEESFLGGPFLSSAADSREKKTVFECVSRSHWKPVLLLSSTAILYFIYLIIFRTTKGEWILFARSEVTEHVEINVSVMVAGGGCLAKRANNEIFSYTGKLVSEDMNEADVLKSGKFLLINDSDVKRLMVNGILFDYKVQLKFDNKWKKTE